MVKCSSMYIKETKQGLKTRANKNRIVDAAKELMRERGFENTSIRDICELANITTGSFYNIFKTKEELLYLIFDSIKDCYSDYKIDYKKDDVLKLVDEYVRMTKKMIRKIGTEKFHEALFSTKNGNTLLFKDDHPSRKFCLEALEGFKNAKKLKKSIDIEKVATELLLCNIGSFYYASCCDNYDDYYSMLYDMMEAIILKIKE